MHTEAQRAYLAGLLDGEGHIAIPVLPTSAGGTRHSLDVRITNTNIEALRQIGLEWGGKIAQIRKRGVDRGWKDTADLRWNTQSAVLMLREIRPYLRMKGAQADVALRLAATLRAPGHHSKPLTTEEWMAREQLRLEIRALNQRGGGIQAIPIPVPVKPTLVCQYCGAPFNSYQKRRKYCSQKCSMAAGRDAYAIRQAQPKACLTCGKEFIAPSKQQYCSMACGRKAPVPRPKAQVAQ